MKGKYRLLRGCSNGGNGGDIKKNSYHSSSLSLGKGGIMK